MIEQSPDIPPREKQDEEVFWNKFFHHLDRLSAIGIEIDQDKIIEIAKKRDMESAKRFLFYSATQAQPRENSISDLNGIIDFLTECGYIDPEDHDDPFMET
jgi:hypothetical protein